MHSFCYFPLYMSLFAFLMAHLPFVWPDVERQEETHDCKFTCHYSTCYDVITLPDDPHTFLTCGEDDCVRWFDLRMKTKCSLRECQEVKSPDLQCRFNLILFSWLHNHLFYFCQNNSIRTFFYCLLFLLKFYQYQLYYKKICNIRLLAFPRISC